MLDQPKQASISVSPVIHWVAGLALLGLAVLSIAIVIEASSGNRSYASVVSAIAVGLMLACGLLVTGAMFGALFGVPRQQVTQPPRDQPSALSPPMFSTNTNLEVVSDWLTKVLIGAALVTLPGLVKGDFALPQLALVENASESWNRTATIAMIVYFLPAGFCSGYLLTRLSALDPLTRLVAHQGFGVAFNLPLRENQFREGAISLAERCALEPLTKVDPKDLRDDDHRRAWARAQAALGNLVKAESIYEELVKKHPKDRELLLERLNLLSRLGRFEDAREVRVQLEPLISGSDGTSLHLRLGQMFADLYDQPPQGFERVIKAGEELEQSTGTLFNEPRLWVYLGCAYGQKHAFELARNAPAAELAAIRDRALYCVRQALDLEPEWRAVLRSLWDKNAVKSPGERDLESFFNDEQFQAIFEPEAVAAKRERALVVDLSKNFVNSLVPNPLAKFSGAVDVRICDASGNVLPGRPGKPIDLIKAQRYSLIVVVQPGNSDAASALAARLDVQGQERSWIDFELNPDAADLQFVPDKMSIVVAPDGPAVEGRFEFIAPLRPGPSEIWLAIAQGRTTVQNVPINIAVALPP